MSDPMDEIFRRVDEQRGQEDAEVSTRQAVIDQAVAAVQRYCRSLAAAGDRTQTVGLARITSTNETLTEPRAWRRRSYTHQAQRYSREDLGSAWYVMPWCSAARKTVSCTWPLSRSSGATGPSRRPMCAHPASVGDRRRHCVHARHGTPGPVLHGARRKGGRYSRASAGRPLARPGYPMGGLTPPNLQHAAATVLQRRIVVRASSARHRPRTHRRESGGIHSAWSAFSSASASLAD